MFPGASTRNRAQEFITRVRFQRDDRGTMQVYAHFSHGSTLRILGDERLAELLRGRWGEVGVEQLGSPEVAVLKPDQSAVMLRLSLPKDLQAEVREKLPDQASLVVPVLFDSISAPSPRRRKKLSTFDRC